MKSIMMDHDTTKLDRGSFPINTSCSIIIFINAHRFQSLQPEMKLKKQFRP